MVTKQQLVEDIQNMERVHQEYVTQFQQLTRAIEQQSGGIQYARMLLSKMEEAATIQEEQKVPAPLHNHVPESEIPL
jgi:hypothetical protein